MLFPSSCLGICCLYLFKTFIYLVRVLVLQHVLCREQDVHVRYKRYSKFLTCSESNFKLFHWFFSFFLSFSICRFFIVCILLFKEIDIRKIAATTVVQSVAKKRPFIFISSVSFSIFDRLIIMYCVFVAHI